MKTVVIHNSTRGQRTIPTSEGPVRCAPGENRIPMTDAQWAAFDKARRSAVVQRWFEQAILALVERGGAGGASAVANQQAEPASDRDSNKSKRQGR